MGKQKFTRSTKILSVSTKILSVLALVFFVISVTAASASGNTHIDASASKKNSYGSHDSKIGSVSGSQYGYKEGYNAGLEDCLKHRQEGVLTKMTEPEINNKWTRNYKISYRKGFNKAYLNGYKDARFNCLKK